MSYSCKQRNIGILAHVDAGKTTLTEAVLYLGGELRQMGRVDHSDSFLDSDERERERGITIFSKQARLVWKDTAFTLLDTPGHVDFSGETERVLPVLDAAVLVISAADGVQSHTLTLWKLLQHYNIPVFLFVNKMDRPDTDSVRLMTELRSRLSPNCADFTAGDWMDQAATESETAMESYLKSGEIPSREVSVLISERKIFPCFFGSALRANGVEALLDCLALYAPKLPCGEEKAAFVYKISRDSRGERLTWLRVSGGELHSRESVSYVSATGEERTEKINQIRLYSGDRFTQTETAAAGTVCAVTGLSDTFAWGGLESQLVRASGWLQPVFSYRVDCGNQDPFIVWQKLRLLEEEEPLLKLTRSESTGALHVQLMGRVQTEILRRLLLDRFALVIDFSEGSILYKETITNEVEGVGHYEPLRHYAEVHLLLEPGERGSGLQFASDCSTDTLNLNWQRLILTHLQEKTHRGVLTGAPITDIKITLKTGRAHEKHTEGGDFRQATYRAVRQGLMQANSLLLEPWYDFRLELPPECVGRAMTDLQRMGGSFQPPETVGDESILCGTVPAAEFGDYAQTLAAYSSGRGRLFCSFAGYEPCRNAPEVVLASGYDAERDTDNTADSVFCSHGAGYSVPWNEVKQHMHLASSLSAPKTAPFHETISAPSSGAVRTGAEMDKELQVIYERTYGQIKRRDILPREKQDRREETAKYAKAKPLPSGPEYLLVDGYNIIFAWDGLRELASDSMDTARKALMDIMSNYQGVRGCELILVFDAYRVPEHREEILKYLNIHVVFTRQAETADAFIEKTAHSIAREHRVRVATSDGLEQLIILGQGALRQSAEAFRLDVEQAGAEITVALQKLNAYRKNSAVAEAFRAAENKNGKKV